MEYGGFRTCHRNSGGVYRGAADGGGVTIETSAGTFAKEGRFFDRDGADGEALASASTPPVTSKLPSRREKNEFYRYYAGYSFDFAKWALRKLELPNDAVIIDPWNGSGTTAAACLNLGMSFQGYDINPVMVHLGRARVASCSDFDEATEQILTTAEILVRGATPSFADIGTAFREIPVSNESARSVAIAALFPLARKLMQSNRTKNPSWFRKSATLNDVRIEKDEFLESWRSLVRELEQWRSAQADSGGISIAIERGDSRKSLGRQNSLHGLMTSPPYLTRLDYVHATLPEILLLKELDIIPDMQRLRRSMLGSPLTSERPKQSIERLPVDIRDLLVNIENHPSKASASYYHRFFSTYFVDLQASMRNIAKVLRSGASGCMVVQSSHYKEIEIDLAAVLISLSEEFGLKHRETVQFKSGRSMSLVNTRAHKEAQKPKCESAVFFERV